MITLKDAELLSESTIKLTLEYPSSYTRHEILSVQASEESKEVIQDILEEPPEEENFVDFFKAKQSTADSGNERIKQEEILQSAGSEKARPWIIFCEDLLEVQTFQSYGQVVIKTGSNTLDSLTLKEHEVI